MFGVNAAPEIVQPVMEEMLFSCSNVINYIDDVVLFERTIEEHDRAVAEVLKVFKQNGVSLNEEICIWKGNKIKFIGRILSVEIFTGDPQKVQVIKGFRSLKTKEHMWANSSLIWPRWQKL